MSGIRAQIADPTVLSLTQTTSTPLGFVVVDDVQPRGVQESLDEFSRVQHLPWFDELVLALRGTSAKLCLYRIPVTDELWLQAACLGEFPEPFFDMLVASTQRSLDRRLLMQVQTISSSQWVMADPVRTDDPSASSNAAIESLALCALETVVRFGSPVQCLPGVLEVLAGPDRLSRRLGALNTLFSSATGIGGALGKLVSGQAPDLAEVVEAFRGIAELPEAIQKFRE